jgi:pyruvate,orthophosphate dikinase
MNTPLVVPFAHGDRTMAALLGGKGANLAEMARLGLPVPPGFIITTEACRAYLADGGMPPAVGPLVTAALREVEAAAGRTFGAPADPLLLSVRSGARFSMPGMMETILDVGLTDAGIEGLARRGGERFAWDCYRRLVQMYGRTVLHIDGARFEQRLQRERDLFGVSSDSDLGVESLREVVSDFRAILQTETGEDLPQSPRAQLDRCIAAVFESWNGTRAKVYRAHEGISEDLGTAVNIMEMVYGNTGDRSGSGVCFTRDPATGASAPYGDYLTNAQGEDVVSGTRVTMPLARMAELEPDAHAELMGHLATLEKHYRDLCDLEFTVQDGRLWMLQTRVGKRSPAAAFRIARSLRDEGVISADEALLRVDGRQLESLMHPRFEDAAGHRLLAEGLAASPGASVGIAVFDPATAVSMAQQGERVVLVRTETSPDDLDGIIASVAIVTARGGLTSHAAVVARGLGRTCVTSAIGLVVDERRAFAQTADGGRITQGQTISVDGTEGQVFDGALGVAPSPVAAALDRPDLPAAQSPDPVLVESVRSVLDHADARSRLQVWVNAETADEAARARRYGARGVGLCRTEHMLLGVRRALVERVILDDEREAALAEIEALARHEFADLLEAMDGLPVVLRLLDPPLHEFLPGLVELSEEAAEQRASGHVSTRLTRRLAAVRRWSEANPMLGLRGVRLLTVMPELVEVHVRAVLAATRERLAAGGDPRPEIMIPLVADEAELASARVEIERTLRAAGAHEGDRRIPIGVMIELPRASLTADRLARHADFFSFGTNDLTQTTWGISRDDAETSFLTPYRMSGILATDPFRTLDREGVGELVRIAIERGRATHENLGLGVCGEHGGDPSSIHFFHDVGVDYVSCSPPRVPVARLEAGRAALLAESEAVGSDTR